MYKLKSSAGITVFKKHAAQKYPNDPEFAERIYKPQKAVVQIAKKGLRSFSRSYKR